MSEQESLIIINKLIINVISGVKTFYGKKLEINNIYVL
jgi:ribosomal protein L6P/L9E